MRWSVVVALLLASCMVASAGRVRRAEDTRLKGGNLEMVRYMMGDVERRGKEEGRKAYITIMYDVKPSLHDKFIDEWLKLEKTVYDEEKNCKMLKLLKHKNDNTYFTLYGEWDDMEDFFDHITSKYVGDWLDFVDKNDVTYDIMFMRNPIKDEKGFRNKRGGKTGEGLYDLPTTILTTFHVPPSMTKDFIGAFEDCAKSTYDEKENNGYVLREVANMNHHYMVLGVWEDFDAILDHIQSKHLQKLHAFAADNDVEWKTETVTNIGCQFGV